MKNKHFISLLSLLLVFALVASGCAASRGEPADKTPEISSDHKQETIVKANEGPSPEPSAQPTAITDVSSTAVPNAAPAVLTNPLTGEVTDKDYSKIRPVAVMLENNCWQDGTMMLQAGISHASIVYEMMVESITRSMAIFMDPEDVPEIGSVRSARSYFVSTALAYDAIYVHCGGSNAGKELANTYLQYLVDNDDLNLGTEQNSYRRMDAPWYGSYHALCTSGEILTKYMEQIGTRMEHNTENFDYGLHFTENAAPTDGTAAKNVHIAFCEAKTTDFTYDAGKNGYTSIQWKTSYNDRNTEEPVVFQNVLALCTNVQIGIDSKNHSAVSTVDFEGTGYFCNGGYYEPITWSRGEYNTPFHYYRADGSELDLGVGRTYIAFVNGASAVSFPE